MIWPFDEAQKAVSKIASKLHSAKFDVAIHPISAFSINYLPMVERHRWLSGKLVLVELPAKAKRPLGKSQKRKELTRKAMAKKTIEKNIQKQVAVTPNIWIENSNFGLSDDQQALSLAAQIVEDSAFNLAAKITNEATSELLQISAKLSRMASEPLEKIAAND